MVRTVTRACVPPPFFRAPVYAVVAAHVVVVAAAIVNRTDRRQTQAEEQNDGIGGKRHQGREQEGHVLTGQLYERGPVDQATHQSREFINRDNGEE
jgi:hypothetical protein